MTASQLTADALALLPFTPLPSQLLLMQNLAAFAIEGGPRDVFVINGYAGTGKTSIVGAVIKALHAAKKRIALLAPTGRAAKVASGLASIPASTIHKRIYRGNSADPSNTTFFLAKNPTPDTLFFIDEASLIGDSRENPSRSLLMQLVHYVYSAPGCRMILIGDEAQLPPVGQTSSLAMNPDRLRQIGLNPFCMTLDQPARQRHDSGILQNADLFRSYIFNPPSDQKRPELIAGNLPDVEIISPADLSDRLSDSWSSVGEEETIIITRSNRRAYNYNMAVRNIVMMAEEPLQRGDKIIISKNDYFWSKKNGLSSFIANGDAAEVTWIGRQEKMYGRYFADVELRLVSDNSPVAAKIMYRSLACDGPSIPREEMERFYNVVLASYDGEISHKIKGALEDPYYNSLQAKYAYCVTCHKAQGGQWRHVYIDLGGIPADALGAEFYRWLYTATTRATEKIFFITNPENY